MSGVKSPWNFNVSGFFTFVFLFWWGWVGPALLWLLWRSLTWRNSSLVQGPVTRKDCGDGRDGTWWGKQGANRRANPYASLSSPSWWQAWRPQVPLLSRWVTVCQSIFRLLHFDIVTVWVKTEKLQQVILAELSQINFYIRLHVYPLTYSNVAYFFF